MNSNSYRNMLSNHDNMFQAVPAGPFEKMAWSGDNSLGNVVDYAPDANNRQIILKLDEWGPPEMWTISLGIDRYPIIDNTGFSYFEIQAQISFGVGGSTQTIMVDWLNGTQLSVPMNAVSIMAQYTYSTDGVYVPPPEDISELRLSAQISRGVAHSRYAPTYTIPFLSSADWIAAHPGAGDQTYQLPTFTREIEFSRIFTAINPFAASAATFEVLLGDGYTDSVSMLPIYSKVITVSSITTDQQRFLLPGGCRAINMHNTGALTHDAFNLICHLGL